MLVQHKHALCCPNSPNTVPMLLSIDQDRYIRRDSPSQCSGTVLVALVVENCWEESLSPPIFRLLAAQGRLSSSLRFSN